MPAERIVLVVLLSLTLLTSCATGERPLAAPTTDTTAAPSDPAPTGPPSPLSQRGRRLHGRLLERYEAGGAVVRKAEDRLARVLDKLPSTDADPEVVDALRGLLRPYESQLARATRIHSRARTHADAVARAFETGVGTPRSDASYEALSDAVHESVFLVLDMTSFLDNMFDVCDHPDPPEASCDPDVLALLRPLLRLGDEAQASLQR